MLNNLIRSPRLWPSNPEKDRRVTWMELFFDLIFVAAVAQIGTPLAADYSWAALLHYSFLFTLIWSAWSGHTLYSTRFDNDDLLQRLLILVQCFVAAVMAANAQDALDSRSVAGFAAAYAGIRIILALQYLRARRIRETRSLTTWYSIGFGVAAVIWVISALAPLPERYWLWAIALTVDSATPWFALRHSAKFPPDAAHFPERFGLFTIILLGEFVAAVMRGIQSQEYWSVPDATNAFSSMTLGFVLWWWYFDAARGTAERHVRSKSDVHLFHTWQYAHLPLFLGIGIVGAGLQRAIGRGGIRLLRPATAQGLCVGGAALMIALAIIGYTSGAGQKRTRDPRIFAVQLALGVAVGIAIPFARMIDSIFVVVGLLIVCIGQTALTQVAMSRTSVRVDEDVVQLSE